MEILSENIKTLYLLGVALSSIMLLLYLIVKVKLHAFIGLILVSFLTAIFTGVSPSEIVPVMLEGFGSTLASVALLVGLGAMIGVIIEKSGGAQVIADKLIMRFGEDKAPFALGVASLLFGVPIFFDVGLVVMMPIILTVAIKLKGSPLKYALPSAGAFAVMHAFVPPHPGPVTAASFFNANIGLLLLIGLVVAIPTWYLGSYLFSIYAGNRLNISISNIFVDRNSKKELDFYPSFKVVFIIF